MWVVAAVVLCLLNAQQVCSTTTATCQPFPWNTSFTNELLTKSCMADGGSQIAACSLLLNGCDDASRTVCNATRILSTLCTDKPENAGCSRLLQEYPNNTGPSCLQALALPLPASSSLLQSAQQLCTADDSLPGCETCSTASCSNPLGTLTKGCPASSGAPACNGLSQFCSSVTFTNLPAVCQPAVSANTVPLCVRQNSRPQCSAYRYPEDQAEADLHDICREMPDMASCTLHRLCEHGSAQGPACSSFSLLGAACLDMGGMAGCSSYTMLCAVGSVVRQCTQEPPVPKVPSSTQARLGIQSSCASHFMPSCKTCTNELSATACPDPLTSLSKVCKEHPSMAACQSLYSFCTGTTKSTYRTLCFAGGSVEVLPSMMQYLHQRVEEVVLFRGWVTGCNGAYAGTLIAIVMFGIMSQFLKTVRSVLDAKWMVKSWSKSRPLPPLEPDTAKYHAKSPLGICCSSLLHPKQLKRNLVRTLLTAVILTLDYWNMLICMTFNVGIFVAVILGYCIGTFLFSHVVEVLRVNSKQPLDDTAFYENGASALMTRDLGDEEPEHVTELVKANMIESRTVDACGCRMPLSREQVEQVVHLSVANQCEGCA